MCYDENKAIVIDANLIKFDFLNKTLSKKFTISFESIYIYIYVTSIVNILIESIM